MVNDWVVQGFNLHHPLMYLASRSESFPGHVAGLARLRIACASRRLVIRSLCPCVAGLVEPCGSGSSAPLCCFAIARSAPLKQCFPSTLRSRDTFLDFRNPSTPHSSLFRLLLRVLLRVPCSTSSGLASPTVESPYAEALSRFRAHLPTVFQVGSSLGFLPSEVSLRPRRRTLSGRAFLLAVIRLALDRLRGFQHREPFAVDLSAFVSWTPRR